jgi:hypothetical protein
MKEQTKKVVHITWQEAQRAEAERDRVRRARYQAVPMLSLRELIAARASRDLPKLKATALRILSVKFN